MQSTPGASTRTPTVVVALAIVLALIGVGGVAFGLANKPSKKVASTKSTTTTEFGTETTLPGETTTTAAGAAGGTPTTAKGGVTVTTAKPGGTTATTALDAVGDCPAPAASSTDPGAAQAPAIGTYTFVSCTDASDSTEVKVAAGPSGNGVTRRNITESQGGGSMSQTATEAYGPNGVLDEVWTIKSGVGDFKCDWNPDLLLFPAQLAVGKTWTSDSTCDVSGNKLHITGTGKISGRVNVNVAGTTVNAWVVDATIKFSGGGNEVTETLHDYWDPAHGVNVYRNVQANTGQGSISRVDHLKSLTPK